MEILRPIILYFAIPGGFILLMVSIGELVGSLIKGSREERNTALKHLLAALLLLLVGAGICALPQTI